MLRRSYKAGVAANFCSCCHEVRNLAIRSSEAAKTTNDLIIASISDIRGALILINIRAINSIGNG